jgi:hypothetical protein
MKLQVGYISGATAQALIPEPILTWVMDTTILSRLAIMHMVKGTDMEAMNLPDFRTKQHLLHLEGGLDDQDFA